MTEATSCLIHAQGVRMPRPNAEEVFIINSEADGIVIPWPKGMTLDEAMYHWAAGIPKADAQGFWKWAKGYAHG